jgi:hypothetical protein
LTTKGNKVFIAFACTFNNSTSGGSVYFRAFVDGQPLSIQVLGASPIVGQNVSASFSFVDVPSAGTHTYDIRWQVTAGTVSTATGTDRSLQVVELG